MTQLALIPPSDEPQPPEPIELGEEWITKQQAARLMTKIPLHHLPAADTRDTDTEELVRDGDDFIQVYNPYNGGEEIYIRKSEIVAWEIAELDEALDEVSGPFHASVYCNREVIDWAEGGILGSDDCQLGLQRGVDFSVVEAQNCKTKEECRAKMLELLSRHSSEKQDEP